MDRPINEIHRAAPSILSFVLRCLAERFQHRAVTLQTEEKRDCPVSQHERPPSRRRSSRIKTSEGLWVIWNCGGRDETSRVLDLSPGGLFIETRSPRSVGAEAQLEFLVQEGQIRAKAVVAHVKPGHGVGLKFKAISEADTSHLVGLIKRLRSLPS